MVVFEELRITNNGKNLIIKARIREESYYNNVYIDKVIIDTEETYTDGHASSEPVYTTTLSGNNKSVTLILDGTHINESFREHLFFVYVITKGTPAVDTPCGMDNTSTLGVTLYMGNIYNNFMKYIGELGRNCQVPGGFIDQLLRFKALNIAMDSGHYLQGIQHYNDWFKGNNNTITTNNCGCNG